MEKNCGLRIKGESDNGLYRSLVDARCPGAELCIRRQEGDKMHALNFWGQAITVNKPDVSSYHTLGECIREKTTKVLPSLNSMTHTSNFTRWDCID